MTQLSYTQAANFERVSPDLVERARAYQSAILCDVGGRRGTLNSRIQALHPAMKVAGPAFTVEVRPGDNLMFHVALAVAKPGDVIIVDGKGDEWARLRGQAAGEIPLDEELFEASREGERLVAPLERSPVGAIEHLALTGANHIAAHGDGAVGNPLAEPER